MVDWLLVGFACGLAFLVAEEATRAWVMQVRPGWLDVLLAEEGPGFTWWPFGRSFSALGPPVAGYAGHHVLTGLIAGSVGLAVWLWRNGSGARATGFMTGRTARRALAVTVPVGVWWVAVVDHFGYNATAADPRWLGGELSAAPALMQWSFRLTGHGYGRAWLLAAVLVVGLLVDAAVVRRAAGDPADVNGTVDGGRADRLWTAVRNLLALVRFDLATMLSGYVRRGVEPRGEAMARGRVTARAVREGRAPVFAVHGEGGRGGSGESAADVRRRRRAVRRLGAAVGVLLVLVGVVVAAWLAARMGPLMWDLTADWLAGLFERLGRWWNSLPWWGQLLIAAAIVALIILSGGSLGLALGLSGVATYGMAHGGGIGALLRDPRGASGEYLRTATPGRWRWMWGSSR